MCGSGEVSAGGTDVADSDKQGGEFGDAGEMEAGRVWAMACARPSRLEDSELGSASKTQKGPTM